MRMQEITEYFNPHFYEMSNFQSSTTGLPSNVKLWVREEPVALPHIKYRIKLTHSQKGSAVFAIWGDKPVQVAGNWNVQGQTLKYLNDLLFNTSEAIRQHIDGKIDSAVLGNVFLNYLQKK